jgi:hypothetical protein
VSDVGSELAYVIPKENSGRFAAMFRSLDEQKVSLGITSYGMSVTTLEDVFLRVCSHSVVQLCSKIQAGSDNNPDEVEIQASEGAALLKTSNEKETVRM